jgi:hypothetical protein
MIWEKSVSLGLQRRNGSWKTLMRNQRNEWSNFVGKKLKFRHLCSGSYSQWCFVETEHTSDFANDDQTEQPTHQLGEKIPTIKTSTPKIWWTKGLSSLAPNIDVLLSLVLLMCRYGWCVVAVDVLLLFMCWYCRCLCVAVLMCCVAGALLCWCCWRVDAVDVLLLLMCWYYCREVLILLICCCWCVDAVVCWCVDVVDVLMLLLDGLDTIDMLILLMCCSCGCVDAGSVLTLLILLMYWYRWCWCVVWCQASEKNRSVKKDIKLS